jgi:hypothetical protein
MVAAGCGARVREPEAPRSSCRGDVVVTSADQLAALASCDRLDGSLALRGAARLELGALRRLAAVTGDLEIGPTFDLDVVSLDGVRFVGGAVRLVSNAAATGAFLPALERAASLEVAGNVAVLTITAPSLARVEGDLVIEDNPALEVLTLRALAEVGGALQIRRNPALELVDAAALVRIGGDAEVGGARLPAELADHVRRAAATP